MKTFVIVFLSLVGFLVSAADTNTFYVTDDGMLVMQNSKGEIKLNRLKVEAAKKLKESLPASEFPEGNWGNVAAGFQLSLRFETNLFASGSPIVATILLRNVTNCVLTYHAADILGRSSPIPVIMIGDKGERVPLKTEEITVISARDVKLFPGTQQKLHERIDATYDLPTNGMVKAYAMLKEERPSQIEVESAQVPIEIR